MRALILLVIASLTCAGCGSRASAPAPTPAISQAQTSSLLSDLEKQTPQTFPDFASAHSEELQAVLNQNPPTAESKRCEELADQLTMQIHMQAPPPK